MSNRDITLLKASIAEFQRQQECKLQIDFIKLLLQAERLVDQSNRAERRTVERPIVVRSIGVFIDALVCIVVDNPDTTFWLTDFCEQLDRHLGESPFHFVWRDLIHDDYPAERIEDMHSTLMAFRPATATAVENDHYIAVDHPDRERYVSILNGETGRFRELASLCRLNIDTYNERRDPVLVNQYSKALNAIRKAQNSLTVGAAELIGPEMVDQLGMLVLDLYCKSFTANDPNWREQLAERLDSLIIAEAGIPNQYSLGNTTWTDPRKRAELVNTFLRLLRLSTVDCNSWFEDGLKLVQNFSLAVRAIMDGASRDDVLARFVGKVYPYPRCAA